MILLMLSLVKHLLSPSAMSLIFLTCSLIFLFMEYQAVDIGQRSQGTIIFKSTSNNFIYQNLWPYFFFYAVLIYPLFLKISSSRAITKNSTVKFLEFEELSHRYISYLFFANIFVLIFIFLTANISIILDAEFYSQITTPEEIGINPLLFTLLVYYQIPIGFLLGMNFNNLGKSKYLHLTVFFLIVLIPLSGFTRLGLLPIAAFMLANLVSSNSNYETIGKFLVYAILFFLLYAIVMLFRGDQAIWSEPPGFGYLGFFRALLLTNELLVFIIGNGDEYGSMFEIIFGNIFNGSAIFFESISQGAIKYSYDFEILSLFSISSQLDNFNEIYLPTQERINFFIPMNAIGEIYYFSIFGKLLAFVLMSVTIFLAQKLFYQSPLPIGIIFCSPIYLFIFYSSQYSTRASFKFLFMELSLCVVWLLYQKFWIKKAI